MQHRHLESPNPVEEIAAVRPLGEVSRGFRGLIVRVGQTAPAGVGAEADAEAELERRLLEMGFIEGARVELLHEGFIGRDPIAVRVDDTTIALRRRDAAMILVTERE